MQIFNPSGRWAEALVTAIFLIACVNWAIVHFSDRCPSLAARHWPLVGAASLLIGAASLGWWHYFPPTYRWLTESEKGEIGALLSGQCHPRLCTPPKVFIHYQDTPNGKRYADELRDAFAHAYWDRIEQKTAPRFNAAGVHFVYCEDMPSTKIGDALTVLLGRMNVVSDDEPASSCEEGDAWQFWVGPPEL